MVSEAGYDYMWKMLDQEFIKEAYLKADDAQAKYDKQRRAPYKEMDQYIRDLKQAKRGLEKEDPGTKISEISFARKLLRKAGLTKQEQRQVLAAAGAQWVGRPHVGAPSMARSLRVAWGAAQS